MRDPADKDPSPSGQESDALRPGDARQPLREQLAHRVLAVLEAMHAAGEDAEERYQEAVRDLHENVGEAIVVIARLECEAPRQDYATRWALVHLVAEMEEPAALPLLKQLALAPIPPEESDDPHSSTVAEETIIRTTAVDGVAALAKNGNEEALEALLDFAHLPSFSIRRAAVQGLLSTPKGDDYRDRIRDCLPKDQQFLLDLKKLDVRKAPQVDDPLQHLSERGRADDKPAAPDITDRSEEDRSIFEQRGRKEREQTDNSPSGPKARDED